MMRILRNKFSICLIFAFAVMAAAAPTFAQDQVPIVDPLSVTTPTPTADPNSTPTPESAISTVDELSLVDATPEPAETEVDEILIDELQAADLEADLTHGFNRTRYYTVRPDDTLLTVVLESGINMDEMWCVIAPDFTGQTPLVIGDILEIPPPDVACHAVAEGETLLDIAEQYDVLVEELAAEPWNELEVDVIGAEEPLPAGLHLRVPLPIDPAAAGEELVVLLAQPVGKSLLTGMARVNVDPLPPQTAIPDSWPFGSGYFRWPVSGWLSQGYHARHRALDIASPLGTVITAADRGVVIRAGWNHQGYGNLVIVDHKNDFLTLYAHLSEILVEAGQIVSAGEVIGEVGSTGNSTGPHLHFEIRDYGTLVDPLVMLTR